MKCSNHVLIYYSCSNSFPCRSEQRIRPALITPLHLYAPVLKAISRDAWLCLCFSVWPDPSMFCCQSRCGDIATPGGHRVRPDSRAQRLSTEHSYSWTNRTSSDVHCLGVRTPTSSNPTNNWRRALDKLTVKTCIRFCFKTGHFYSIAHELLGLLYLAIIPHVAVSLDRSFPIQYASTQQ